MKITEHLSAPFLTLDDHELESTLKHWDTTPWVMDTETDGLEVIGPYSKNKAYWIGLLPTVGNALPIVISRSQFLRVVKPFIPKMALIGHNLRFDLHALGIPEKPSSMWDTQIWQYHNSTSSRKSLDFLAAARGWSKIATPDELKQGRILELNDRILGHYLADDCITTLRLFKEQNGRPVKPWLINTDFPLELTLQKMEERGVILDIPRLHGVETKVEDLVKNLKEHLVQMGFDGNLGSSKQLAKWLHENGRDLPYTPKGNPSTDKQTLMKLADKGDTFCKHLLEWRRMTKLLQAFFRPLPNLCVRGKLHANINSARTVTGRFSYNSPNLQQIPKPKEDAYSLGKELRKCISHEGGVSVADYSQVELRVAAALSNEPVLLEAFAAGADPHKETAAAVFKIKPENVTKEQRHMAKTVNFGILFGAGPNRLSNELKISIEEARRVFRDYKTGMAGLSEWCDTEWAEMEISHVAKTASDRTRIFGANESTRPGLSVVIQGTASELMRAALINVEKAGLKPILSVHDEIVTKGKGNGEELAEIMKESAEKAFPELLSVVEFPADGEEGNSWGELE